MALNLTIRRSLSGISKKAAIELMFACAVYGAIMSAVAEALTPLFKGHLAQIWAYLISFFLTGLFMVWKYEKRDELRRQVFSLVPMLMLVIGVGALVMKSISWFEVGAIAICAFGLEYLIGQDRKGALPLWQTLLLMSVCYIGQTIFLNYPFR